MQLCIEMKKTNDRAERSNMFRFLLGIFDVQNAYLHFWLYPSIASTTPSRCGTALAILTA